MFLKVLFNTAGLQQSSYCFDSGLSNSNTAPVLSMRPVDRKMPRLFKIITQRCLVIVEIL